MAMNTRSRGIAASTDRHRAPARPLYEDFTPQIEAKEDREANTVYIRLPGFSKEQLRIVADTSRGILRVRGERPLAGSTWSRFLEEVPVPEDCDMRETRARFEGGALRITMPKRIPAAAPPQPQSSPSSSSYDEPASPQPSPPPAPSRPAAFPPPQPVAPRPAAVPPPKPDVPRPAPAPTRPAASRPAALLPPEPATPRPTPSQPEPATPRPTPPQPEPAAPRPAPTQPAATRPTPLFRLRDDHMPVSMTTSLPPLLAEARPSPLLPPPQPEVAGIPPRIQPRPREEIQRKPEPSQVAPPPAMKPAPTTLHTVPHPAPEPPRAGPIAAEMIRRRTGEKQSPALSSKAPTHLAPAPADPGVGSGGSTSGVLEAKERVAEEETKKRKGMMKGWRLEEERKMLMNMGAAALVIAGLGAWISYTLGSPSKSNN